MSKFLSGKLNTLQKIQHLKSFVGTNDVDDAELTECLRLCGYNLERAAQKLLTGEFRQARKKKKAFLTLNKSDEPVNHFRKTKAPNNKPGTMKKTPPSSNNSEVAKKSAPSSVPKSNRHKTPVVTPKADEEVFDLTMTDSQQDTKIPAAEMSYSSSIQESEPLLLCRRWLADDIFVTSRTGRVDYKEQLQMDGMIRFRGKDMEGRLPRKIAKFLLPLGGYVHLAAESLMEDRNLKQGQGVPIQLTVTLLRPKAFFECIEAVNNSDGVKTQHYFRRDSSKTGRGRKRDELSTAEAAFQLIQWAEYGDDIPDYAKEKHDDTEDEETVAGDDKDSNNLYEGDEEDAIQQPHADESTLSGASVLKEALDPPGFTNGVSLRPYQRQALFFLNERETVGADREQVAMQLNLLRELSEATKTARTMPMSPCSPKKKAITCDCGPVRLAKPEESSTLGGEVNPVNHPLWKRRFLATPSLDKSFVFYVNELLGVALSKPPPPPSPCSGGIL